MPDSHPILTNLLSGLFGALFGGWVAGFYIQWQTRELSKHELRAVVLRMGFHVATARGTTRGDEHDRATDPWFEVMPEAIACYQRFRALLMFPWQRRALDADWQRFQGTEPQGDDRFMHAPLMGQAGTKRVCEFLDAIA